MTLTTTKHILNRDRVKVIFISNSGDMLVMMEKPRFTVSVYDRTKKSTVSTSNFKYNIPIEQVPQPLRVIGATFLATELGGGNFKIEPVPQD